MFSTNKFLYKTFLETPLGRMVAIADEECLYLLDFEGRKRLEQGIEKIQKNVQKEIIEGKSAPLVSIEKELAAYFSGTLTSFQTKTLSFGTPFQKSVWKALQQIPFGKTLSYGELATSLNNPKAFRAVARANGENQLAILVPCHRVIYADKSLGGYAGGLDKKKHLLHLESKVS